MRKFLLTTFVLLSVAAAEAQQGLFFNCTRDTVIDCTQTCVTLTGYIPNLHSLTDNYEAFSLNSGICNVRMQPSSAQGTPTNIIADDRYTPIVLMPFDFPFYGIYYNQLVASSNGIISFDLNNASAFSHYGILSNGAGLSAIGGAPQNLPNTRYDRAIIMGPYHDIDISVTTSPNRRIFYQIEGNTPNYRKWILNFQEIPLFSGACNPLFRNTHQIILHESTGIVDVYIFDKQICMNWNEGRAMVGMQNYDRNNGIMIPGRRASDAPWGAVGMNEAWRFVPSEGPSLFKKVELLDASNAVVAVGDTTSVNNTVFAVSFPNVCPSASGTFIIRSTYAKIDDPTAEIYAYDTVNIIRNSSVPPVTTTVTDAPCGVNTTGTINVTAPLGANYLYSIDNGTTFQASPVFTNVAPGTYSVVVKDGSGACFNSTVAIVNTITTLTATATVTNTSCPGASNGAITVNASLGTPGYEYAIDGGATPVYGSNNIFTGLDAGTHSISVKDAAGCIFNFNVDVNSDPGFTTTATSTNASCIGVANGFISVDSPLTGVPPFKYYIAGIINPQASPVLYGLAGGASYSVTVEDASGCTYTFAQGVNNNPGVSATFSTISASCAGVSNGQIVINPTSGGAPFLYSINGGSSFQALDTVRNLAAGTYNIQLKDTAGCTFNSNTITVFNGAGVNAVFTPINASCAGVNNGRIAIRTTSGTAPFEYSLDGGTTYQPLDTIRNLAAGTYNIRVKDANGCTVNSAPVIVGNNPGVTATFTTQDASCTGVSNGTIAINPSAGAVPYSYSVDGGTSFLPLDTIRGLAAGSYNIIVRDAVGCSFTAPPVNVNNGPGITATLTPINASCTGVSNGQIAISPASGTGPYSYSMDGGATYQPVDTIRNLASGNYSIRVSDALGCTYDAPPVTVNSNAGITAGFTSVNASCAGISNGKIAISPTSGTAPFSYSLDGGTTYNALDTIRNLAGGTYSIRVRDDLGCTVDGTATVNNDPGVAAVFGVVNTACTAASTGKIGIAVSAGVGPFEYSLNGGTTYNALDTIRNLGAGNYNIRIRDAVGCLFDGSATVGANDPGVGAGFTTVNSACTGVSTGRIIINPTQGIAPFSYSLDGGATYNTLDTIRNLAGGTYSIRVRDDLGCTVDGTATVNNDPGVAAVFGVVNTACTAASTGKIGITVSTGIGPFEYSLNGGTTYQPVDTIRNLGAGNYNIRIRDAVGCLFDGSAAVGANDPGVGAGFTTVNSACTGVSTGRIIINPTQGIAPFSYSLDGGATYNTLDTIRNLAGGTYSIRVRDDLGCTVDGTATVNNDPGVAAVFGVVNTACTAASTGKIGITVSAGVGPFEYSLNGGATYNALDTIRNLGAGNYNIRIRDAVGCLFDGSATVGANDPGVGAGFTTVNSACTGVSTGRIIINPTQGIAPFSYSLDGGATYNTLDTIRNLAGGTYNIRIRDDLGCTVDGTATVNNDPGVAAVFGVVNTACTAASTGKIGIAVSAGVGPFEYSLNGGATYNALDTIRNLGAGNYNIRIRDAVGCLFDGSATVGANDPGVGAGFTTVNSACTGVSTGRIIINPTQGIDPFSYSLDGGATYNALDTIRNLAGGTYNIRVRDDLGCTWDAPAVQVGEDIGVTASFSSVNTACASAATGALIVNTLTGQPGFIYSIDGGVNFQSDPVFRKLAVGNYTVRIRDAVGCVFNSAAQQINANPGVQTTPSTIRNASCESVPNGSITVNITAGISPFEYTLSSLPGALPQPAGTFANLFPGPYNILIRDSAGCTLTLNETVGSDPKVRFNGLTIVRPTCNGASNGTVTAAVTLGVAPYSYSLDGSPFTAAASFSNVAAGNHLLTVRDANNCSIDTSFTVTEPAVLSAAVSATTRSTCTGTADGSITITAAGGTTPYQYTLDPAGSTGFQAASTLAARAGNYTVTVQDALGCKTTTAARVDSVFNMFLDLGRDTTLCAEQSFVLRPLTNNETGTFVYTPAASLDNAGVRNPTASPLSPTTYRLTATFGICSLSDSVRVEVLRKPVANAGSDVIICFNGTTTLTGSASNASGPVTFSWSPAQAVDRADTAVALANPAASQVFTLTVRDNYGCNFSVTDEVLVTKLPEPAPFAGNDTNAVYGIPHQLTGIGAGAGGTYDWELITPVNGSAVFSNRTSATPTIVFQPMGVPQGITYDSNYYRVALTTTDAAGCQGYDTVTIHIYNGPTYYVPSAFSPNNDGVNDIFRPVPVGVANTEYFRIFNRYGQMVYETNRFRQGWDGTFKGQPQPLGAYVWLLKGVDRNGRKIELKGTVMLVR